MDADSPGLPGQSSRQRVDERRPTGTWADKVRVIEIPERGRPRFNRMGHRIKVKERIEKTNFFRTSKIHVKFKKSGVKVQM